MRLRRAKYYFSAYRGLERFVDTDIFMSKYTHLVHKTYMCTWYSKNTGFYVKFSNCWPRCYDEKNGKQKKFTYNSNHHLLVNVEVCYVFG